jgi:hypothetical protein
MLKPSITCFHWLPAIELSENFVPTYFIVYCTCRWCIAMVKYYNFLAVVQYVLVITAATIVQVT